MTAWRVMRYGQWHNATEAEFRAWCFTNLIPLPDAATYGAITMLWAEIDRLRALNAPTNPENPAISVSNAIEPDNGADPAPEPPTGKKSAPADAS